MDLPGIPKKTIQGYVYASNQDNELFRNAKTGDLIVKKDKTPPYIVVDHSLDTLLITRWPGKLFKVEVIDPSKEKGINEGLVKGVSYTRTFGVEIIEEVPPGELFGPNGKKIEQIVDLTRNITEEQVFELSKDDKASSRDLYAKAWRNWIMLYDKNHPYLNGNHHHTLLFSPKNERYSSPIKIGLSLIYSQFDIRAKELVGDQAFGYDEEGEIYLQPIWALAVEKALQAGMSYASDDVLTELERETLRTPFNKVFGLD